MRNWLETKGELKQQVSSTLQRLDRAFLFPEHENRDMWLRYLLHVLAALEFRNVYRCETKGHLLFNVGASYSNLAKYQEAEEMYWQTLELKETVLGCEHPDTLASMNNLANVLDSQGKYSEAEQMH